MNDTILDKDPSWMQTATISELQQFVKILDEQPDTPKKRELLTAFNTECNRRTREDFESRNGGEWI